MLRHYLSFAIRGIARQKLHSCLSIAVLTLGLTCFIGAAAIVLYIDGYEAHFPGAERLEVIYQGLGGADRSAMGPGTDDQLKEQLELIAPELAAVARLALHELPGGATAAIVGGTPQAHNIGFADPAWADLFALEAVAGRAPAAVLAQPRGAIVTEEVARQLFGDEPAVGKTLKIAEIYGEVEVTVGAVVKPVAAPSHLAADVVTGYRGAEIVGSWSAFEAVTAQLRGPGRRFRFSTTYALLPADGSLAPAELDRRLTLLAERMSGEKGWGGTVLFSARHVSQLIKERIETQLVGEQSQDLPVPFTGILLVFAGLVLGVACLNFVNLATARSASRAREIGVRKSLGAGAYEVLRQDLVETAVAVGVSILLALAIVSLAGRFVAERWQVTLALPWSQPEFWLLLIALLMAVTVLAGAYPASVLARIRPVTALRLGMARAGPKLLRTALISLQCAAATLLVFAVLVFHLQTDTIRKAVFGRLDDPLLVLNQNWRLTANRAARSGVQIVAFDTLMTELARGPGIRGVAGNVTAPFEGPIGNGRRLSRSPDLGAPSAAIVGALVTAGYRDVLELPLLAGRWFADDRADESQGAEGSGRVVLDARAVSALGFANPDAAIGALVYDVRAPGAPALQPAEIIGVVGNSPLELRSAGAGDGLWYRLVPGNAYFTLVRLDRNRVAEALRHIESVREALAPNAPAGSAQFLDQAFADAYSTFDRVSRVVTILAGFAMAIAGVGLFGMANFLADRRTREIGLRKTQGATTRSILHLLLVDFSKPVLIANVAIWPFAYITARVYVNLFVERMPITPLPFVATLAATLLLAWLVIGARVVRAARTSPTVALRQD
jgi:putative ABC transport system permease protein